MTLIGNKMVGCGNCSSKGGCGIGSSDKAEDGGMRFNRPLEDGVMVGDHVTVVISTKLLFSNAFILYILPIIMLFIGAHIGENINNENELYQIMYGSIGFFGTILYSVLKK
jgi:sigma-E factor negative regulatory protein RseC